jgi:hypothetical protein
LLHCLAYTLDGISLIHFVAVGKPVVFRTNLPEKASENLSHQFLFNLYTRFMFFIYFSFGCACIRFSGTLCGAFICLHFGIWVVRQLFSGAFVASSYASIATRPVYMEEAELVVNFPCCYTCPFICVKCQCKVVHHTAHMLTH